MTAVYGMHRVRLREGITGAHFERFFKESFLPALEALEVSGVAFHLLQADRGEELGEYLFMMTFDRIETRERYFPAHNRPAAELLSLIQPIQALSAEWEQLSERQKTDYICLAGGCRSTAGGT